MLQELQDIGLSEKEARVYLASLELGKATADKIAKQAGIKRPTAYLQIKSLMEKGLMSTYEEGKKTYFAPESPELLRRLLLRQKDALQTKERDLTELLPALFRQFESAGERPVVRFFPGKEGVTTAREEILTTREKNISVIFSYGHLSKVYSEAELDEYSDRRKSLGIYSKAIYTHQSFFEKAGLDELTERRSLAAETLPLTIDIWMFDDKVAIFSLQGNLFALIVQSAQITASIRLIFNFLWEHAESAH